MKTIYEQLAEYSNSDYYGFHMPGHKRSMDIPGRVAASRIDITEIDGFDDLHCPEGMLKQAQERAASLYGSESAYFLVNGSTVGILSSIFGTTNKGDKILVARNCHKSVYHAIYMHELRPVYVWPGFDEARQLSTKISPDDVRKALDRDPQIRAVIIVSPTYDGVVSDVAKIAAAAHEKGVPLIVDEAHGAHFGFHPYFPENSNRKGADIVIHSVHKTLPALTQSALLHINGSRASRERVQMYLHMLQSSSPSYVLMAGIDSCMAMLEQRREGLFGPYVERLKQARERLSSLSRLRLVEAEGAEPSKIILSADGAGITGKELYEIFLRKYHLQMEMYAGTSVTAMTSVGDTAEGFDRLVRAAAAIDAQTEIHMAGVDNRSAKAAAEMLFCLPKVPVRYMSADMERVCREGGAKKNVLWRESAGHISLEYAYLYPPGIPLIVPGEEITEEAAKLLDWYEEAGYRIEGPRRQGHIEVWTDGKDILYDRQERFR